YRGQPFDDKPLLGDKLLVVTNVTLRGAKRVDAISFYYNSVSDGSPSVTHGGGGGELHNLDLQTGDYVKNIEVCVGSLGENDSRIFYAKVTAAGGASIEAGVRQPPSSCHVLAPDEERAVVGGYGRSAEELDRFGVWTRSLSDK
ncbi:putative endonuclease exonuclease phosphatase family protein, partial [Rhizoctonia solani 123E]